MASDKPGSRRIPQDSSEELSGSSEIVRTMAPSPPSDSALAFMAKREKLKMEKEGLSAQTQWKVAAVKSYFDHYYDELYTFLAERKARTDIAHRKLQEREMTEAEKKMKMAATFQIESEFMRERRRRINNKNFETIKIIGRGGFGEVRLVRQNGTNELYAMKRLRKEHLIDRDQIKHVRAERALMVDNNAFYNHSNPWVVNLVHCFQDANFLYLVMEYMPGGDLMEHLIRRDIFTEEEARFYLAELILALDSIHQMGYIHRDIKPDNILLDVDGHIKLGDFGLCTGIRFAKLNAAYQTLRQAKTRPPLPSPLGVFVQSASTAGAPPPSPSGRGSAAAAMSPRGGSGAGDAPTPAVTPPTPVVVTPAPATPSAPAPTPAAAAPAAAGGAPASGSGSTLGVNLGGSGARRTSQGKAQYLKVQNSFRSWARKKRVEADSNVGTTDYIAPEILFGQTPYGKEVDYWSAGCILFEMLVGPNPDPNDHFREMCDLIADHKNHVRKQLATANISDVAKDLILHMLCDRSERLGRNSADEVMRHPFFKGIDWDHIVEQTPPYVPVIKDPLDTSHFPADIEPEPEMAPKYPEGQHKEFFVGFTYRNFKAFKKAKRGSLDLRRSKEL